MVSLGCPKALVDSEVNEIQFSIDGATQEVYEQYRRAGNLEKVLRSMRLDLRRMRKQIDKERERMARAFGARDIRIPRAFARVRQSVVHETRARG